MIEFVNCSFITAKESARNTRDAIERFNNGCLENALSKIRTASRKGLYTTSCKLTDTDRLKVSEATQYVMKEFVNLGYFVKCTKDTKWTNDASALFISEGYQSVITIGWEEK